MRRAVFLLTVLLVPGVALAEETAKKKSYIGVQIAVGKEAGSVVVLAVIANSPAAKGGLKGGDIIHRIDGARPADLVTTVKVIAALKPGKKATFLIERDGKKKEVEVTPVAVDE